MLMSCAPIRRRNGRYGLTEMFLRQLMAIEAYLEEMLRAFVMRIL